MNKEIRSISVEGFGTIYRFRSLTSGGVVDNGVIEVFTKNGEMAPVQWYRQNKLEFNGRYVISIEYI